MVQETDNDPGKRIQANQQIGIIGSSLEHQVLEQLNGEQGFSAVKAIQLANLQGQKIYTITKDNYEETLPMLHLAPAAIADIQAAAKAGLTVTTHERRISINGYTGEGYIILNEWGDGAYMINGGLYGGGFIVTNMARTIAFVFFILDESKRFILLSGLMGSIFFSLGLVSNLMDYVSIYDGTAGCLNWIVFAIAYDFALAFLTMMFVVVPIYAFMLNLFGIFFHDNIMESGACRRKK